MVQLVHDGLTIRLKEWHDFSWLADHGRLFCVFDQLISGNICFGIESNNGRFLIKYAGAPTLMFAGQTSFAVNNLRHAAELYRALRHPNLNALLGTVDTRHGFALVFPWFEGFALAPLEIHMEKLHALPLRARFQLYDGLMDFLVHASTLDYVAAGIANQHILVDFINSRAIFSSASHFLRLPAITPYPKLPGSSWYLPPEAYIPGADLDERATVYALGALAFTLFSHAHDVRHPFWDASEGHRLLAERAMQKDRDKRPHDPASYQSRWRGFVHEMRAI